MRFLIALVLVGLATSAAAAPAPHITSITPSSVTVSSASQVLIVTGSRFSSRLTVSYGVATDISSSRFTVTAVFQTPGYVSISVHNPDGKTSNALTVAVTSATTIPTPVPPPATTPAPVPSSRGPQAIAQPIGSVAIAVGTNIQTAIDANPAGTSFWLPTGGYVVRGSNTPKSGDTFTCASGAVLDGTGWITTNRDDAAFKALNQDIDYVTIKNCQLVHMPQRAISSFKDFSDHWTIENVLIDGCFTGIVVSNFSAVRNSIVRNCIGSPLADSPKDRGGGYMGYQAHDLVFENNEWSNNGPEQKLVEGYNYTWRSNWFHNTYVGIWTDGDNKTVTIEGNLFEDITWQAIFPEISQDITIRNNTIRRAETAIFASTSKRVTIVGNTLEDNWRGITLFLNCSAIGGGTIGFDLADVTSTGNTMRLSTRAGSMTSSFAYEDTCPPATVAPYLAGKKGLIFQGNTYTAVPLGANPWNWGDASKTWTQWQALGQDTTGTTAP